MTFTPAPIKPPIEIADLEKIDIRVGTILSVEDVGNSDKLLKLLGFLRRSSANNHRRDETGATKSERN
jgi:hypothetical protein